MKVLQVVKTNSGARWALKQALELQRLGVDYTCMLPCATGGLADSYRASGIQTVGYSPAIDSNFFLNPWSKIKEFRAIVSEVQPDLIHTHFVTNTLFVRLALRNMQIPRVFQVPGPMHLDKVLFRKADVLSASKCWDYWMPTCRHSRARYMSERVNKDHIRLVYYGGYGGDEVNKYIPPSNKLRNELGISSECMLIGMVGYFYKPALWKGQVRGIKGHEDFFDAMEYVLSVRPDVRVVVIGGPWNGCVSYESYLKRYANWRLKDKVYFTGFRNDLHEIYRDLSIAVHPSHSENLGGAAESLAAGVPAIATEVGGFPDIVLDGQTGRLVPPRSPRRLAEAIIWMIDNYPEAKSMADAGKKLVEDMLDIRKTSSDVLSFYEQIMEDIH